MKYTPKGLVRWIYTRSDNNDDFERNPLQKIMAIYVDYQK